MKKAQGILNGIFLSWLICLTITTIYNTPTKEIVELPPDTIYIKEEIQFDTMEANVDNMHKVCDSLGIKFPKIVISQAILESGNFKSQLFKANNNPLGLYDSKHHRYYKFNHWTSSLYFYKDNIQSRHREGEEDYYDFLDRIGYAEDKKYISKLKEIEKGI